MLSVLALAAPFSRIVNTGTGGGGGILAGGIGLSDELASKVWRMLFDVYRDSRFSEDKYENDRDTNGGRIREEEDKQEEKRCHTKLGSVDLHLTP